MGIKYMEISIFINFYLLIYLFFVCFVFSALKYFIGYAPVSVVAMSIKMCITAAWFMYLLKSNANLFSFLNL